MPNLAEYLFDLVLGGPVILVGVVTNLINIRVFWRQGFSRYHVNVTLLALAVTDLTCLACAAVYRLTYVLQERESSCSAPRVLIAFCMAQLGVARVTYCLTALLSLERWIAVCHPLRAKSWLNKSRLTRVTIIVASINFCLHVPFLLVVTYTDPCNPDSNCYTPEAANSTRTVLNTAAAATHFSSCMLIVNGCLEVNATCFKDHFLQFESLAYTDMFGVTNDTSLLDRCNPANDADMASRLLDMISTRGPKLTYVVICTLIVVPAICNQVVTFCTAAILCRLRKMSIKRLALTQAPLDATAGDGKPKTSAQEGRLVKAILTVMVIFLLSHTPTTLWAHAMLFTRGSLLAKQPEHHISLITGLTFLETFNSSVNFFIYITWFPGFKRTFAELYPRWSCKCR